MKTQWIAITVLATISMAIPCSQAQNKSEAAGLSGLAHVAIRVSDVDREVAFFNKLGYELAFANTKDGKTEEAYIKIKNLLVTNEPERFQPEIKWFDREIKGNC